MPLLKATVQGSAAFTRRLRVMLCVSSTTEEDSIVVMVACFFFVFLLFSFVFCFRHHVS